MSAASVEDFDPAEYRTEPVVLPYPDPPATPVGSDSHTRLTAIAAAPVQDKARLIDDFLASHERMARRIAAAYLTHHRLDRRTWADDLTSLVREAMWLLVKDVAEGKMEPPISFEALARYRSANPVRRFLDSSAGLNQASGQKGLKARFVEMRRTMATLSDSGITNPAPEQVVEETNRRMESARRNPKRQGVICSVEDYNQMLAGPNAPLDAVAETATYERHDADESRLNSSDASRAVDQTMKQARAKGEKYEYVAHVWLISNPWWRDGREQPTIAEIAAALDWSPATTRRYFAEVKTMLAENLMYAIELDASPRRASTA